MAGRPFTTTLSIALATSLTASSVGAQTFGPETIVTTTADGANCLIAADIDGDGLMDLVGTEYYGDRVVWHRQLAPGQYSGAQVITSGLDGAWHVRVADFDGDGDNDVVATGASADQVRYMENLGGSWKLTILTASSDDAGGLALADLDGDGDQDILAASDANSRLALFKNNGGTFVEKDFTITGAWAVTAFDGDGDGDMDIYVGGWSSDTVYRLTNDGTGQFGPLETLFIGVDGPSSLRGRDLDGDGDLDLLVASRNDSTVAWYPNSGAGSFGPRVVISTTLSVPYQADAADVDDDGDLEVFVASNGSSKLAWFEGQGGGLFGPMKTLSSSASGARYVSIADLDGDDDLDVLGASLNDDTFGVYQNILPLKKPKLLGISGLHSLDAGEITLDGENLLATTVLIDGVAVAVTGALETRLTFDLGPSEPGGLHSVTLENAYGLTEWPDVLPRYPVLDVQPTASLGESVPLLLDNGTDGAWVLAASGALFSEPAPFVAFGWYYGLELNGVWMLGGGVFTPGSTQKTVMLPAVTDPSLVGVTFYLQAWTTQTPLGYAGFTATGAVTVE